VKLPIITIVAIFFLLFSFKVYGIIKTPDLQCSSLHATTLAPPLGNKTARDFFELGNYNFDIGSCHQAIEDYTRAIQFDPSFARAYNNRAYTNMRLHNYKDALTDLNKAIVLDPNYATALMNRGDIYNYYFAIDRKKAIDDYNKVISLGADKDQSKSVCGHKAMAQTNNMVPLAILRVVSGVACK
jgi:tetratricopeptide (TPR) repeat protein